MKKEFFYLNSLIFFDLLVFFPLRRCAAPPPEGEPCKPKAKKALQLKTEGLLIVFALSFKL